MKFENTEVFNFNGAIRGARNPLESWKRSDSGFLNCKQCDNPCSADCNPNNGMFKIGENDLSLLQRLIKASIKEGNSHSKFMRQIFVSVDITAPLYWWKEMDQYRVGVTTNSTSTMHKLSTTPITIEQFEIGNYNPDLGNYEWESNDIHSAIKNGGVVNEDVDLLIPFLENLRITYLKTKDKQYWYELIRWLPESWLQTRTTTMNYQVLRDIYFSRRNHKLDEWSMYFIKWIKTLPYATELIMYEGVSDEEDKLCL